MALIFGLAASYLKMPPLLGYLIAGVMIGPATPGFVADIGLSQQLAEIGVMLLMFGVGLHFSFDDLMAVKKIAVPGALLQIIVVTALGFMVASYWDLSTIGAIVFGLSLSVASTVVLLRVLESKGLLETANGQIAVGWLVVEDLAMVLALVLLPVLAGIYGDNAATTQQASSSDLLSMIGLTLAKVAAFIALMLVVGKRLLPKMLWLVAKSGSRELFTLAVIATAIGVAFFSAELFDVSFALGAFFAGMMLGESELSKRAADESLPLRDAFAVLFFVSVGMVFNPEIVWQEPLKLLIVVSIILIGNMAVGIVLVLLFNYPLGTALTVGVSLAQIGFSLLQKFHNSISKLILLDINKQAINFAKKTVTFNNLEHCTLIASDSVKSIPVENFPISLILSNPPHFSQPIEYYENSRNTIRFYDFEWKAHKKFLTEIVSYLDENSTIILQENNRGSVCSEFRALIDEVNALTKNGNFRLYLETVIGCKNQVTEYDHFYYLIIKLIKL